MFCIKALNCSKAEDQEDEVFLKFGYVQGLTAGIFISSTQIEHMSSQAACPEIQSMP